MTFLEKMELLSYVVTVVGLPFAIIVYLHEQRKERRNEEEEIFQRLSDEYRDFLKLVLDNADLHLLRREGTGDKLTEEQAERRQAIFGILISLFERAYLLVYEEHMPKHTRRMWQSWEDYIREWVRRADFRDALPTLLEGEDEEFTHYIHGLVREEDRTVVEFNGAEVRRAAGNQAMGTARG
jgi:hypothetical protein